MKNIIRQKSATQWLCVQPAFPKVRVAVFLLVALLPVAPVSGGGAIAILRG